MSLCTHVVTANVPHDLFRAVITRIASESLTWDQVIEQALAVWLDKRAVATKGGSR